MSEPQFFIVTPKRRGRPSKFDDGFSSAISTRVKTEHHDRLIQMAKRHGVTPAEFVRRLIQHVVESSISRTQ